MFKRALLSTQLTTDEANSFFQHTIVGGSFQGDVSFISTLRALVAPRMSDGDFLSLSFTSSSYSESFLKECTARAAVREVTYGLENWRDGTVVVHNFHNIDQASNYAWLTLMKSTFTSVYAGWHCLEKVTEFYKKTFYALCFINPEKKSAIIFVENMDIRKMHYLQCSIFAFLPWYFDPKQGVSKLEMELIESLRDKNSAKYEDCIAIIAEQYDFRAEKIRRLLAGFETRYEYAECENVRRDIRSYDESIEYHNESISEFLKQRRDAEIRLLGLEAKIASGSNDSEMMDYFLRNDRLVLEGVNDDYIVFIVKTYIEYFDEDLAERVINNDTSYVYRPDGRRCNNLIPEEDIHKLMVAIFVDQSIRVRVCAAYEFSMSGRVRGLSRYSYNAECREFTPNPHIDGYSCIGNYSQSINELLRRRDYISAIEQCAASCKSLNFNDSTVMNEFMRRIYGISERQDEINMRCFELPDGTVVSTIDAINWLNSGGANNE